MKPILENICYLCVRVHCSSSIGLSTVMISYMLPQAAIDLKIEVLSPSFLNISIHGGDNRY